MSGDLPSADRTALRAVFAAAARGRLDALERLLLEAEGGDGGAEPTLREAHTIRGSATVLGLGEIAGLAAELESVLRDGRQEEALAIVGRLRAVVDALPSTVPPRPASAETEGPAVLYIEDDRPNALLVQRMLRQRPGVTFLDAPTGAEGLRLARERRPALVLLDLRLPDMHGLDVLERLRADPETAGLQVALLTGGVEPETMDRLDAAGVRDVIGKPFDVGRLLAVVDTALEGPNASP